MTAWQAAPPRRNGFSHTQHDNTADFPMSDEEVLADDEDPIVT